MFSWSLGIFRFITCIGILIPTKPHPSTPSHMQLNKSFPFRTDRFSEGRQNSGQRSLPESIFSLIHSLRIRNITISISSATVMSQTLTISRFRISGKIYFSIHSDKYGLFENRRHISVVMFMFFIYFFAVRLFMYDDKRLGCHMSHRSYFHDCYFLNF